MKRLVNFVVSLIVGLSAMAQMPELTVEQHVEDYDFAVKYIENNYAGFPNKVVDSTLADYEAMKTRIRAQVATGGRTCWDAVAEYTAWFNDFHTRLCLNETDAAGHVRGKSDKYRAKKHANYDELMVEYDPRALACKVTDKTYLIRFPSCYGDPDLKWVEGSIQSFMDSGCENLILDIRGNSGGSDGLWTPYYNLLADHDGEINEVEYRNTPAYRDLLIQEFKKEGVPEEIIAKVQSVMPMLAGIPFVPGLMVRQFYGLLSSGEEFSLMKLQGLLETLAHPEKLGKRQVLVEQVNDAVKKAALIIDGSVASSGEQLVVVLRALSARTTIYGSDNTSGCLDYSNLIEVEMPNSGIKFTSPMSRTMGLPATAVDPTGIAPDVRITLPLPDRLTDNIDEWVAWIAAQLEK